MAKTLLFRLCYSYSDSDISESEYHVKLFCARQPDKTQIGKLTRTRGPRAWRLQPGLSCLSWKWRKRSSVKIAERTDEEATEALHAGRKSSHSEAAFGGRSADLGSV